MCDTRVPVTVDDYRRHVEELLTSLGEMPPEPVDLNCALGRVTSDDLRSPVDLPLFRNSQMDGYAVDARSLARVPVRLRVTGSIAAGDAPTLPVSMGTGVKIMTGAPLPAGADTVVPIEDTEPQTADETVVVWATRRRGEFVRERGSDVLRNDLLLTAATKLATRHLAVLAAVGMTSVSVRRRLRVAVISTGAELRNAGESLEVGTIFDCNRVGLAAAVTDNGAVVSMTACSSDNRADFESSLMEAVAISDIVITSGGVSMGDYEVVREVVTQHGGSFGHISMQPGGPQGWAVVDNVPVLCLPGNPVSALVSFEILLRPSLRRTAGLPSVEPLTLTMTESSTSIEGKRQFLRGVRHGTSVSLVSGPQSHLVAAMAGSNVLIDIPESVTSVSPGVDVQAWPL